MNIRRIIKLAIVSASIGLAGSTIIPSPAHATNYYGPYSLLSCLNDRTGPGTRYASLGVFCPPDGVYIDCQTTDEQGYIWDRTSGSTYQYIPAGYMFDAYVNTGYNGKDPLLPWC